MRTAADPTLPQSVVGRVLTLLTAFRPGDAELTLAELHRPTGIAKPTIHRLLAELDGVEVVYVRRRCGRRRWASPGCCGSARAEKVCDMEVRA